MTACTGSIGGTTADPPGSSGDDVSGPAGGNGGPTGTGGRGGSPFQSAGMSGGTTMPAACKGPSPGPLPMRRLTRRQFANTVRELFGSTADIATDFPDTFIRKGYRSFADANSVTADGAEDIASAGTAIAAKVTANLPGLLGCTPGNAGDDACARGFIAMLARKAYRRPVLPAELDTLNKVYADLRTQSFTAAESMAAVIEATLSSPQFLYLSEVSKNATAAAGTVQPLTDHEIAARLSYGLWDAPPDAALSKLADDGKLNTPAAVEAEARRLLADKRAEPLIGQFVEDWLELYRMAGQTKDAKVAPQWNETFAASLRNEVSSFATEVAFRGDHMVSTWFSAPWTMASSTSADIYGATKPAATTPTRVDVDATKRLGILTSAAFLSSHASSVASLPIVRGAMIRRHVLCTDIEVPPGLMVSSPVPDPNVSAREQTIQHSKQPMCAACHALMDPLGFALENFDAVGRFRTVEGNNLKINPAGSITEAGDANGDFTGPIDFAQKIAGSTTARDCVAEQLFTYMNARPFIPEADQCALGTVTKKFADAKGDLRELIVAIAGSDPFLYRLVPEKGQ